jgi:hypothetical protein
MDAKPYLVLDFSALDETLLPELDKLTKDSFDLDSVISAAGLVAKAARQFLNEQVNDRLKNALGGPDTYVSVSIDEVEPEPDEKPVSVDSVGEIVTSDEEIEGYRIVRAIVCGEVPVSRVVLRDTKTYCGVLLDDNNRKPIARLWLNRSKKYLGVFDENKVETRIPIDDVEDIYRHADHLRKTVARYLVKVDVVTGEETVLPVGSVIAG